MSETKIIRTEIYAFPSSPCIFFLKGLPASGKSKWAEEYVRENDNTIRLNKDDFRKMMGGVYNRDKEDAVIHGLRSAGIVALSKKINIIIDDTNFSESHLNFWKERALADKYTIIQIYFETPVDVCIRRDALRGEKSVGAKVIENMANTYINDKRIRYADQDEALPKAIIVDIDGTLALMNGRTAYQENKVDTDAPNIPIIELIQQLAGTGKYNIIVFSGRQGSTLGRKLTTEWLDKYLDLPYTLLMRQEKDNRKDSIVKRELFEHFVQGQFYISWVFDDRNQVVDMWRKELYLPCLQVNYGDF